MESFMEPSGGPQGTDDILAHFQSRLDDLISGLGGQVVNAHKETSDHLRLYAAAVEELTVPGDSGASRSPNMPCKETTFQVRSGFCCSPWNVCERRHGMFAVTCVQKAAHEAAELQSRVAAGISKLSQDLSQVDLYDKQLVAVDDAIKRLEQRVGRL